MVTGSELYWRACLSSVMNTNSKAVFNIVFQLDKTILTKKAGPLIKFIKHYFSTLPRDRPRGYKLNPL